MEAIVQLWVYTCTTVAPYELWINHVRAPAAETHPVGVFALFSQRAFAKSNAKQFVCRNVLS